VITNHHQDPINKELKIMVGVATLIAKTCFLRYNFKKNKKAIKDGDKAFFHYDNGLYEVS